MKVSLASIHKQIIHCLHFDLEKQYGGQEGKDRGKEAEREEQELEERVCVLSRLY
jgi:hypothetical protein